jgi:hypothetical protein
MVLVCLTQQKNKSILKITYLLQGSLYGTITAVALCAMPSTEKILPQEMNYFAKHCFSAEKVPVSMHHHTRKS